MQTQNEREIATFILMDLMNEGSYNNIILRKTLNNNTNLTNIQKKFITEIVNGSLRNLIHVDYIINSFSKTKTTKMKPFILSVLRTAVYQIKFMDKVPVSAVCNTAVELTKSKGFKGLSGFVNGVLRNIIRNIDNITYPDFDKNKKEYLSVLYSIPEWILEYFKTFLNEDEILEFCKCSILNPKINICVNTKKTTTEEVKAILENEGVLVTNGYFENSLNIRNTSNISALESFKNGLFHVMDNSSMRAVQMINPQNGEKILDMCAAPGGKCIYASYLVENQRGSIVSCDIFPHKIKLMNENIQRLGIESITTALQDATEFNEDFSENFDKVLVDAPCSGFGIIRKKPDIKLNKTMKDVKSLAKLQKEILENASKYVKKGGYLIYSTCTISKMENIDNVNWFIENFDYESIDIVEILPNEKEPQNDGFFIAKFQRRG